MDLLKFMMDIDIKNCLTLKNMMACTIESEIEGVKRVITDVSSHYHAKIKVHFYDPLPTEQN